MDEQRQDDQLELIYNSSILIQYGALKIYRKRWTIETGDGTGPGRYMLTAWHDHDDYNNKIFYYKARLILILKRKEDGYKNVNLLKMATIFPNYCKNTPWIDLHDFSIIFSEMFVPFLINSSVKWTNIWMGSCICFLF